ncbi:hypothetical protein [Pseudomonas sp. URMO17WK12:I11]|uniref:hypothetical protein n=1 Tax=Pseudomonas sp. URMO17WK12:I11 TaxID=1283291 RepID=UPI0011A12029|nr:hypothetical protein [Pseudomonas sp. URMO17WK12:I11]
MSGLKSAFCAQRNITAWRDREFDVQLSSTIQYEPVGVRFSIEEVYILLDSNDAEELARALYEAVNVTVGNKAGYLVTPAARETDVDRSYRRRGGLWDYVASARFQAVEAAHGLREEYGSNAVQIMVETIRDCGIQLVGSEWCCSFSMEDAVWMSNSLMEAAGQEPLDAFETFYRASRPSF